MKKELTDKHLLTLVQDAEKKGPEAIAFLYSLLSANAEQIKLAIARCGNDLKATLPEGKHSLDNGKEVTIFVQHRSGKLDEEAVDKDLAQLGKRLADYRGEGTDAMGVRVTGEVKGKVPYKRLGI